jgi:hypothetical protein
MFIWGPKSPEDNQGIFNAVKHNICGGFGNMSPKDTEENVNMVKNAQNTIIGYWNDIWAFRNKQLQDTSFTLRYRYAQIFGFIPMLIFNRRRPRRMIGAWLFGSAAVCPENLSAFFWYGDYPHQQQQQQLHVPTQEVQHHPAPVAVVAPVVV